MSDFSKPKTMLSIVVKQVFNYMQSLGRESPQSGRETPMQLLRRATQSYNYLESQVAQSNERATIPSSSPEID